MTITKHDGVAIIPKRCDKCNRLFWLEPYDVFHITVGIAETSLKQVKCLECINNECRCKVRCNDDICDG